MLGVCIGKAFHPTDGMCSVFQDPDHTGHVVLVSATGSRRIMRRELVQWRRPVEAPTQRPGPITQSTHENPAGGNVVSAPTLFDLEEP